VVDSNHDLMCCIDFAADVFHSCFYGEVRIKCKIQVLELKVFFEGFGGVVRGESEW